MSNDTLICMRGVAGCMACMLLTGVILWAADRRARKLEDWADRFGVAFFAALFAALIGGPAALFGAMFAFGLLQQAFTN